MSVPDKVYKLVERFDKHIDEYKDKNYKEAVLCTDFLNPMFESLGWDVRNRSDRAERFRDVVQQFSQHSGSGSTKQPDYLFRIGGTSAFFLEAKKPAVKILSDKKPAYQLRKYGWNGEDIDVSILSDFEHLCVYDTRIQPKEVDHPYTARLVNYKYQEYIEKWDEIEGYLGRENVSKGSLDSMLKDYGHMVKGIREPVDESLLKMIEIWREKLAKDIAHKNTDLDIRLLNSAVQKTIDRILFLRIAEDRGIEKNGELKGTTKGKNVYKKLFALYKKADIRYNSGLFHFKKEEGREDFDNYTKNIEIDDGVLKEIIGNLYRPNYPFDFSIMPVDILGHVYEKFLGRVITLSDSHQAIIEEKPEVRKAGGVYYTPKYIVDYIVKNTVGKLLEEKTPKQATKLKILDPACGSGSFLLGAYQYLLDWHLDWYCSNDPEKHAKKKNPPIYEIKGGWRLATEKKKEILLNNIYGVDIDTQAVEVAKLNLLLKVLEEENNPDLGMYRQRALPDLGENIKCGNSLIENDYYKLNPEKNNDLDHLRKINAFDWDKEFPEIIKWSSSPPQPSPQRGEGASNFVPLSLPKGEGLGVRDKGSNRKLASGFGFDAVIGNPPYVDSEWMTKHLMVSRKYCTGKYFSASGNWDMFCVFIERACLLAKKNGFSSMIVPNKLLSAKYAQKTREFLHSKSAISIIRDYSRIKVFPVSVYPIVYVAYKGKIDSSQYQLATQDQKIESVLIDSNEFWENETWQISTNKEENKVLDKISSQKIKLSEIARVLGSATVSEAYKYKPLFEDCKNGGLKVINSGTIDRYSSLWGLKPMQYIKQKYQNPCVREVNFDKIRETRIKQSESQKIIVAGMTKRLECFLDEKGGYYAAKSTSIILESKINLKILVAILNSKLVSFFFMNYFRGNTLQGGYLRIGPPQLKEIPIPDTNKNTTKWVQLVETMLELNKQLAETQSSHDKKLLKRQIEITDKKIDELVYELYDLTPEEIQIVEDSMK